MDETAKPAKPTKPGKPAIEKLSRGDLLGVLGCIVGIGGVVFELDWIARAALVTFAIGLIIYAAQRHSAHIVLRGLAALVIILAFVGLSARPIWTDFHAKYPKVVLSPWMIGLLQPYAIPKPPAPPSPRQTDAIVGRAHYRCVTTGKPPVDQKEVEKNSAAFGAYMRAYAQENEYVASIKAVSGGDEADLTPDKPLKDYVHASSISYQLLWVGRELKGIYSSTYVVTSIEQYPLIRGSQPESHVRETLEGLAGVEGLTDAKCELQ